MHWIGQIVLLGYTYNGKHWRTASPFIGKEDWILGHPADAVVQPADLRRLHFNLTCSFGKDNETTLQHTDFAI